MEAEELYYQLYYFMCDRDLTVSSEADEALADVCRLIIPEKEKE